MSECVPTADLSCPTGWERSQFRCLTRTCPSLSCPGWNAFLSSVRHRTQPTITVKHVLLTLTRSDLCILLVVGRCVLCVLLSWEWSVSGGAVRLT